MKIRKWLRYDFIEIEMLSGTYILPIKLSQKAPTFLSFLFLAICNTCFESYGMLYGECRIILRILLKILKLEKDYQILHLYTENWPIYSWSTSYIRIWMCSRFHFSMLLQKKSCVYWVQISCGNYGYLNKTEIISRCRKTTTETNTNKIRNTHTMPIPTISSSCLLAWIFRFHKNWAFVRHSSVWVNSMRTLYHIYL